MANNSRKDIPVNLKLQGINVEIEIVGQAFSVGKEGYKNGTFIIKIDPKEIHQRKTPIQIGVYEGDKKIKTAATTFIGPEYEEDENEHKNENGKEHDKGDK